ncbi:histidine phosphatase superfamily [Xylaria digitata]|nr:histidine phosphatase superfamily [Xylaria digitata]
MPPTIHIMRHGESEHNVSPNGDALRDPNLTYHGQLNAQGLGPLLPHMTKVRRIISSPLRRAIQTSLLVFDDLIKQDMKILVLPELKEAGWRASNTGSSAQELREEFGFVLELGHLSNGWWYRDIGRNGREDEKVAERARQARSYIRTIAKDLNDDEHIVIVTHRGVVKHLVEDPPKLKNLEARSYQFVDLMGDDNDALLVEIK